MLLFKKEKKRPQIESFSYRTAKQDNYSFSLFQECDL